MIRTSFHFFSYVSKKCNMKMLCMCVFCGIVLELCMHVFDEYQYCAYNSTHNK